MRHHGGTVVILVASAALAACTSELVRDTEWHQEAGYRWRELHVAGGKPGFTRMESSRTGIGFQNYVSDSALLGNRMLGQGGGVALGDVDGDGLVDIFLVRTQGPNALYRNLGNWRFEDITAKSGLAAADRYKSGAALADVNGDGALDLILLSTTGPNAIFINDGTGHFTEHGADLGIDPTGRGGTTITMADVDGDGWLDLFIANYKAYSPVDSIPPEQRTFDRLVRQVGKGHYEIVPEHQRDFKLVTRPDVGGLNLAMRGASNDLYLNDHGRFKRVPFSAQRFLDARGKPFAEEFESFSLSAKFADLNGDGAPDLYVANDFEDLDQLWINDGQGSFRLADWTAQRQMSNSSMGVDIGDVNGDGLPDIFVADMLSKDPRRVKTQIPAHAVYPKRIGDIETQLQQQRNTLFLNRGDGTFSEVGLLAGVRASGWSWGSMLLDVDLDGRQDILITTGHLWDLMDADTQQRLQSGLGAANWRRERWEYPPLRLNNVAFRNRGDLTFEDVSDTWHFAAGEDVSHGIAAADLDGDGDLDVVINRLGAPALILRNDASAPRIAVRLVGDAPNTKAVGAKVRLYGGAVPLQAREVAVGGLYLSHSDYEMSFAMGKSDSARLVVDWRDGRRTTIARVRANRQYEITAATAARPSARDSATSHVQPLFEDVTAMLGGHTHVERPFDDWQRQFLLPNSLAQLGPGVAWFDYDGDGQEDLIIGSGGGGRLAVFHNEGGKLVWQKHAGTHAATAYSTVVGIADERGRQIVVGTSTWELPAKEAATVPSAVSVASGQAGVATRATPIAPPSESTTGPIAVGDYDGDGRLDLFIGGRAIPGQYPRAASSMLLHNDGGTFTMDTANADVLKDVGLISAAVFADIDGDGDEDLILAREWGPLLLLLNDKGRFRPAPASWGLGKWTSRWNGLAVGDLDGDGKLDIVATSWGRNTMAPADSGNPLFLLYGPFGSAGETEMLLARQDARLHALSPLNAYPRVQLAVSNMMSRIPSFAAYADATVDQVLGRYSSSVERTSIVTLDNMVFMNRGQHFEAKPLPLEAQFAPAFYVGIADFDGDGNEDVFLSQNFYPTAPGLPRYDAGRGLLLTGDGRGGLTPMSGTRSGILIYGDQRGAAYADFDGDGRLDLVVSQNGSKTRLLRNRLAKPGLRVRLRGSPSNPDAIGAQVRIVYGDRMGPVREVQAGSGYWSQNAAVQVFGLSGSPTGVWVRWPGGREQRLSLPPRAREITVNLRDLPNGHGKRERASGRM